MKEIVSREQAEKELNDFFDAMDIDTSRAEPAAVKYMTMLKDMACKAIMAGRVTFTEDNEPVIKPWRTKDAKPLTIKEPSGANLMASGVEESVLKAALMQLAEMTGTSVQALGKLKSGEIETLRLFHAFFTA